MGDFCLFGWLFFFFALGNELSIRISVFINSLVLCPILLLSIDTEWRIMHVPLVFFFLFYYYYYFSKYTVNMYFSILFPHKFSFFYRCERKKNM